MGTTEVPIVDALSKVAKNMETSHLYSLDENEKYNQKKKLLLWIFLLALFFVSAASYAPIFLRWIWLNNSLKIDVKNEKLMIPCNYTDKIVDVQSVVGFTDVSESAGGFSCSYYQGPCSDAWQCKGVCYEYGFNRYSWYQTISHCTCE